MEEFFEEHVTEDENIDIMQYVKAVIRRWWLVCILTLAMGIPWMLYIKKQPLLYEADAWITFDNATGRVPENLIQSRIMKLRSRTFAETVTADLGLTLHLNQEKDQPNLDRQNVFTHFSTTKIPTTGNYLLRFYPSGYSALYHETERLDSLRVEILAEDTVTYNGLHFVLNEEISKQRSHVSFFINDFQGTVGSLIARENIIPNDAGDILRISLVDTDPYLAAKTVNMLTGIFIEKSLQMRDEERQFRTKYLNEQLALIREELSQYDQQLKSFRTNHLMGLDAETRDAVDEQNELETQIRRFTFFKEEVELLLGKLNPADTLAFDQSVISHVYIYRQIAELPIFEQDADMAVTRRQLADLDNTNQRLANFPPTNPERIEVSERIQLLEDKIFQLSQQKIVQLMDEIVRMNILMDSLQVVLQGLPDEELRFIRLDRQRNANEEIYTMLQRQYIMADIDEAVAPEKVSILDDALPPIVPITGNGRLKKLLGLILGFFLGVGCALLWEVADRSIKTRHDVKRYLKLPILGSIPRVKFDDYELQDSEKAKSISSQIVTHDYSPTPVGEAYRSLRTSLLYSKNLGPMRTLIISSVSPGEGKSFTAANLAITLAQQKSKTLLIDTDLRRGVLHNSFNCPKKPGLTNYLTGVEPLERVVNETYVPNLSLITCGSLIPNPSELLGSNRMRRFVDGISKRFNFIIFDTPPLNAATDAVVLGTLVDGVAVLIRVGKTNRENIRTKLELFQNVQSKVVGVILNCAGVEVAHEGYSYYAY